MLGNSCVTGELNAVGPFGDGLHLGDRLVPMFTGAQIGLESGELAGQVVPAEALTERVEDVRCRLTGVTESGEFDAKNRGVEQYRHGGPHRRHRCALIDPGAAGRVDDAGSESDRRPVALPDAADAEDESQVTRV